MTKNNKTRIVFACQSNSCRSQMAEGWAREWMRRQLEVVSHGAPRILERLRSTKICSVALNEDLNERNNHHVQVKPRAIQAMADNNIDISSHYVKTLNEALDDILLQENDTSSTVATTDTATAQSQKVGTCTPDDDDKDKPIDKLIVLCSCGDTVRQRLEELSNHVHVWNIEAPSKTVDTNKTEGDAYHRVSLQIRDRIYELMEQTVILQCQEEKECGSSRDRESLEEKVQSGGPCRPCELC